MIAARNQVTVDNISN